MSLFEQLKASPDAVLIMKRLQEHLKKEEQSKKFFFDMVHENVKAEYINGEIVMHSPVRLRHWLISGRLSKALMNYVDEQDLGLVGVEKVMIQLSRNCYEPDIVFFRKEVSSQFTDDQKLFPVPDLVVEILSESTQKYDYGIKFRDYEAHEIGEYWIVDPENDTIEQYVLLEGKFELQNKLVKKGILTCLIVPHFQLDIEKVFAK